MNGETGVAPATLDDVAGAALARGLRRIHVLTWRDLDHPDAGGSEIHINAVARRWLASGLDVTIVTSAVPGQSVRVARDGYQVRRAGGRLSVLARAPLAEMLRVAGPRDGLVEVWHGINFLAPLWARGPRIGIAHHVHGAQFRAVLSTGAARLAEKLEHRIYPRVYRRTSLVTLSESNRQEMLGLGYRPELVTVARPGVDPGFTPGGDRSVVPLVLGVGRLMPQKHFDVLVDVLVALRRRSPDLRAVIAGDGPERAALDARIRAAGASDWLVLAGRVSDDELVDLYRRAWVLASASSAEGWGMTVTEAGACGTPAVVNRIPGHVDAVEHGVTGFLAGSHEELSQHLDAVLAAPDLRERLGRAARAGAASMTWDDAAARILAPLVEDARRRAGRVRR